MKVPIASRIGDQSPTRGWCLHIMRERKHVERDVAVGQALKRIELLARLPLRCQECAVASLVVARKIRTQLAPQLIIPQHLRGIIKGGVVRRCERLTQLTTFTTERDLGPHPIVEETCAARCSAHENRAAYQLWTIK